MNPGSFATIWPYLIPLGLLIALAWFTWRRGDEPSARPLVVSCLFQALWLVGAAAEVLAVGAPAKIMWFEFQAMWKMPTVTATTCFALEYVYPGRWLTRRNLLLLSIPPLLVILLVLTNDLHHWYWSALLFDGAVQPIRSPLNWLTNVYGMALVLINVTAFVWLFIHSRQHRWPAALLVLGQLAGRGFYAVDLAIGHGTIQPDPFILSAVVTVGAYAIALFAFRILDPLPAARQTAIEQMRDGMVVFDTGWLALSLNPAAERILGVPAVRARGKAWSELLPSCPDPERCLDSGARPADIRVGMGIETRHYTPALSRLQDYRGLTTGYLALLRDVTEERRAQVQLLEQQWAQATLQERELLAQELHDGIAQNLGFLNLQAQTACLFLGAGQDDAARDSLSRLAEVAQEMQGDTRDLIGDLLTVSLPTEDLCSALRRAVERFEEQVGWPVSLDLAEDADAICSSGALPPAAGVQLLRILQEALANVRKHAGSCTDIAVRVRADDGHVQMMIEDNGAGFDSSLAGSGKHFGLQVMGQRAERIGGRLTVHSAPGEGTRVEVFVPLDENNVRTGRAT